MRRFLPLSAAWCLFLLGCSPSGDQASSELPTESTPTTGSAGLMNLSPENTKIEFIGRHTDDRPDRNGGFQEFTGIAEIDPATSALTSVSVEIKTDSIWSNMGDRLTNHLKSEDFFDVRQFPAAKFSSSEVTSNGGDEYTIRGDLTLLAVTKEISFPAQVTVQDGDVKLRAQIDMDRTEWGMDRMLDGVTKDVSLTVVIGEKTEPQIASGGGPSGGGDGRRGGGRGNFDPAERFRQMDANEDGKLTGDEISGFLSSRMETIDSDGDGALTLEEMQQGMRGMFQGGGRRGQGGGEAGDSEGSSGNQKSDSQ